jgi:hypothetical protein
MIDDAFGLTLKINAKNVSEISVFTNTLLFGQGILFELDYAAVGLYQSSDSKVILRDPTTPRARQLKKYL